MTDQIGFRLSSGTNGVTDSRVRGLTINVDGEDILDRDFGANVGDGEAYLNGGNQLDAPFDSAALTNSSVRIGVRDDDAWAPGDIFVFGHSLAGVRVGRGGAAGLETGLTSSSLTRRRDRSPCRCGGSIRA